MGFNLAEKLKSLRKDKNVSQDKLAGYLNVSFQAVSKWENGNTYPDISLLPDIARFFGITIDELLQVEKFDEKILYKKYENKAAELYHNGNLSDTLLVWIEAYQRMPNNVEVKEMLMSCYFDIDKIKYQKEIIELGTEIYNSDVPMYYKGQAIEEIARTYSENGNYEMAKKWIEKTVAIIHSQEILYSAIDSGDDLISDMRYCVYWIFNKLFYMACNIAGDEKVSKDLRYKQDVFKSVVKLYETLYENDDMGYESLKLLYLMHVRIAEMEIELDNNENIIIKHLNRAAQCVEKSMNVEEHKLSHPLLYAWVAQPSPTDNKQCVRLFISQLSRSNFDACRNTKWFNEIEDKIKVL